MASSKDLWQIMVAVFESAWHAVRTWRTPFLPPREAFRIKHSMTMLFTKAAVLCRVCLESSCHRKNTSSMWGSAGALRKTEHTWALNEGRVIQVRHRAGAQGGNNSFRVGLVDTFTSGKWDMRVLKLQPQEFQLLLNGTEHQ